jgi:internalin A
MPNLTLTTINFENNNLPDYVYKDKLKDKVILQDLTPYIIEAIKNYYGEYRLFMNESILDVQESNGSYLITVRVTTFVGPHNPPYGIETVTIKKDWDKVTVEQFKHEDEA